MKVTVIGSGTVGKTLAIGFKKHAHSVSISTRNLQSLNDWSENEGKGIPMLPLPDAANNADLIVLAVKGLYAHEALEAIGKEKLAGKIIVDTSNPIAANPPQNGVLEFFTNQNESLMERLQGAFPNSHFVKAFNSIGSHLMVNPQFADGKACMPICGNNSEAKIIVTDILRQFGFDVMDFGSARSAGAIESLCILWCIPGFLTHDWVHGIHWLRN